MSWPHEAIEHNAGKHLGSGSGQCLTGTRLEWERIGRPDGLAGMTPPQPMFVDERFRCPAGRNASGQSVDWRSPILINAPHGASSRKPAASPLIVAPEPGQLAGTGLGAPLAARAPTRDKVDWKSSVPHVAITAA